MTIHPARGAVAAGHMVTAEAAAQILQAGGNAFDATIAALATATVAEPVFASPGGGGFIMALEAGADEPVLIDFFGHTPRTRADPDRVEFVSVLTDFGPATQEFHIGHGATATPGFLPGLAAVHASLGSAPLEDLLRPAISAARTGVAVTEFQAFLFSVVRPILMYSSDAREVFCPNDRLAVSGDILRNQSLADFLEMFGRRGLDFWTGEATAAMLTGGDHRGHLTPGDVASYRVEQRLPLRTSLGEATLFLNPPPSAGGAMIAAMAHAVDREGLDMVAAMALADEARLTHSGDPARLLDALAIPWSGERTEAPSAPHGTTHVSVIDATGNAAAATVTNGEGNGHIVKGFGFMPNNLLGEADLLPGGPGSWGADIRLASMTAPTIMRDRDGGITALGSGGSKRIRSAIFQALTRLTIHGLAPAEAVDAPRAHIEDGHLDFEDLFETAERERLVAAFRKHRAWPDRSFFYGGVHVVMRAPDGTFSGAGDRRRAGVFMMV